LGVFATATPLIVLLLGLFVALAGALVVIVIAYRRRLRRPGARSPDAATGASPEPAPAAGPDLASEPSGGKVAYPAPPISGAPPPPPPVAAAPPPPPPPATPAPQVGPTPRFHAPPEDSRPGPSTGEPDLVMRHAEWRPDPFGRHRERRFFLGVATSVVRDGDVEGYDAVPGSTGAQRAAEHLLSGPPPPPRESGPAAMNGTTHHAERTEESRPDELSEADAVRAFLGHAQRRSRESMPPDARPRD
jgi:hypothetical protein